MDVLPFLAREERQEGISLGPATLFVASSFSRYSIHMESGLVSRALWGPQVLWPRPLPPGTQV